jgi:hypothetical protein
MNEKPIRITQYRIAGASDPQELTARVNKLIKEEFWQPQGNPCSVGKMLYQAMVSDAKGDAKRMAQDLKKIKQRMLQP